MNGISTDPGFNRKPKYKAYEVIDVHTNKVIGVYPTRAEATGSVTEPSHRVRGSYSTIKGRQKKSRRAEPKVPKPKDRDRSLIGKARIRARRSR